MAFLLGLPLLGAAGSSAAVLFANLIGKLGTEVCGHGVLVFVFQSLLLRHVLDRHFNHFGSSSFESENQTHSIQSCAEDALSPVGHAPWHQVPKAFFLEFATTLQCKANPQEVVFTAKLQQKFTIPDSITGHFSTHLSFGFITNHRAGACAWGGGLAS
jgi:hypothetical protein